MTSSDAPNTSLATFAMPVLQTIFWLTTCAVMKCAWPRFSPDTKKMRRISQAAARKLT